MEKKKSKSTFCGVQSEQTGSVEDMKKNPLDIPEIVAIVVGNIVKVEDLKTIRALNKQWRDEAMKKWRNSAVFVITKETKRVLAKAFDDSALIGLSKAEREKVLAEIDPFLLREIPFRNYRFEGDLGMTSDFERDLIFNKVIVPHAKYLDLGEWIISDSIKLEFDSLERIFRYNLSVTELVLTPLRKDNDYFARAGTFHRQVEFRGRRVYLAPLEDQEEEDFEEEEDSEEEERYIEQPPPTKAPTVHHLTLLSPTPERQRELLRDHGLKPLFTERGTSIYNDHSFEKIVRWLILTRMPNLKVVHGPSNAMFDILSETTAASSRGEPHIKLEEIEIPFSNNLSYSLWGLMGYIRVVRPPLRKIKAIAPWEDYTKTKAHRFLLVLRLVGETLTDLELEVDCKRRLSAPARNLSEGDFFLTGTHLPNLTRFKVVLDYPNGAKGKMLSFDLNHLRKMPKLKEFFFGFKNPAEYIPERIISSKLEIPEESPSWVNKRNEYAQETLGIPEGIHFDPILGEEVEGDGFKHLKSFHFHRNLTKTALQLLGKWTKNLHTLEGIFDKENFPIVGETWPRLQALKLLQGSNVPKELLVSNSTTNISNELSIVHLESLPSSSAMRKGSLRKIDKKGDKK